MTKTEKKELTIFHKLLIFYLKRKNELVKDLTGLSYVYVADLREAESWGLLIVTKVLYRIGGTNDSQNCPWCIIHHNNCNGCQYGKRHGRCILSTDNSKPTRYKNIVRRLIKRNYINANNEGICSVRNIKKFNNEVNTTYKILQEGGF